VNIPDAPPALAPLLRRLLAEGQVEVTQHAHIPAADAWYAGRVLPGPGGGQLGVWQRFVQDHAIWPI